MTMDVIATAACGIDSKAFDNKEPSRFEQMGNKVRFQLSGLEMYRSLFIVIFPKLANLLGMSFFGDEADKFFSTVVTSSVKHRRAKGEKYDDFIQLMLEVQANKLKSNDGDILDQFEKDAAIINSNNNKSKDGGYELKFCDVLADKEIICVSKYIHCKYI